MTNKEKYQRAFSTLHASNEIMEVKTMETTRRIRMPRMAAVCAAVIFVMGLATVAYAVDIGGIQRSIQIWLHGDQTDAVLEIEDGNYTLTYEDVQGQTHQQQGGGIVFEGMEEGRPLTEEDILEQLDAPKVEYQEDGSVWVYYRSQKLEITDCFDEDGVCFVQLKDGNETLYMTVKYQDGYACSSDNYPDSDSFNKKRGIYPIPRKARLRCGRAFLLSDRTKAAALPGGRSNVTDMAVYTAHGSWIVVGRRRRRPVPAWRRW